MKKRTLFWMGICSFVLIIVSIFLIATGGGFYDYSAPWLLWGNVLLLVCPVISLISISASLIKLFKKQEFSKSGLIFSVISVIIFIVFIVYYSNSCGSCFGDNPCLDAIMGLEIVPEKGYTCYNKTDNTTHIQIRRKTGDFNVADVQIIFEYQGNVRVGYLLNATGTVFPSNKSLTPSFLPNVNEEKVFVVNNSYWGMNQPESIRISAIIKAGQAPCDASQPVVLKPCV